MLGQILLCLKLGQIFMKANLVSLHKYSVGLGWTFNYCKNKTKWLKRLQTKSVILCVPAGACLPFLLQTLLVKNMNCKPKNQVPAIRC